MPDRRAALAATLGLCLVLPAVAGAHDSDGSDESLPELDGLAWYRSIDLAGEQFEAELPADQVAQWSALVESAGTTFDELEYTYHAAFDPDALPDLGGMATVRIADADSDTVRDAVVADIVAQLTSLGHDAPEVADATVGAKDVTRVPLPEELGLADALVYVVGDTAWVVLMDEALAASALEQLP